MNRFKKRKHKINKEINCLSVRLIKGQDSIIINTSDALRQAYNEGLDLILISENINPPVVKIEDYNKFIYNQERIEKEKRKNSIKVETKEIQLSLNIADNDLNTKSKKALEFLQNGNKVKCVLSLKGRQNAMPEKGEIVMLKFTQMSSEFGIPEFMPRLDGSRWIMIIKPKK